MKLNWSLEEKKLDLAYNWKISRNESTHKTNFIIHLSDGTFSAMGETAPNIRYNETIEKLKEEFNSFIQAGAESIQNLDSLEKILAQVPLSNSLRFGIESAYFHYYSQVRNTSIYNLLSIPAPTAAIFTSYTIPIMEVDGVKTFIEQHKLQRFKSLKIKISTENMDLIDECMKHYKGPLRIDANEAWTNVEELIVFIEKLKNKNVEFVEQPLPHHMVDEYIHLKKYSVLPLIGDESITNKADFELLSKQFHGINIKLMKAGGYINGRNILQNARKYNLQTMIGCMVETSLGISSGMHLCALADYVDLDGHFVLAKEPFGLVNETDGELKFN